MPYQQRVLVTGANGLLGQALLHRLAQYEGDYDVLATGRDDAPRFELPTGGYVRMDLTRPDDLKQVFTDFAPAIVVNGAAMTEVDQCEDDRQACWRVNASAVEALAAQCKTTGSKLIQVSTDFVFDGEDGPYDERARPAPVNFYGRSKLAAENAARQLGEGRWAIARTVLVYGTTENGSRSNVALWLFDQLQQGKPVHVVTDHVRTPTYAPDLAAGIERMIRYNKSGLYHLSGRDLVSVYQLAQHVALVLDVDPTLVRPTTAAELAERLDQERAPRPPRTGFIILKAETDFGYRPRPLSEALRHLAGELGLPVAAP